MPIAASSLLALFPPAVGGRAVCSGLAVLPKAVISKPAPVEFASRRSAPVSRSLSSRVDSGAAEDVAVEGTAKPKLARTEAGKGRR